MTNFNVSPHKDGCPHFKGEIIIPDITEFWFVHWQFTFPIVMFMLITGHGLDFQPKTFDQASASYEVVAWDLKENEAWAGQQASVIPRKYVTQEPNANTSWNCENFKIFNWMKDITSNIFLILVLWWQEEKGQRDNGVLLMFQSVWRKRW